ncbi:uncharacterized protein LOC111704920 isoform X2 [Eurytemora carolleeae]|uniref:uncharacterized protein LOC111704920 isoform X2 n=1 Tax=Eurytemora carolleeae TaxID=1294199 RepID=UPI000C758C22|nr:uncharacterized protein LOC111704920 isoform X2 [Eurytemora carolleeae]|eukprot:XP_023333077.1 uncharacterized protein LOC111704920 isoform X2 [Eurytemora affinis]
MITMRGIKVVLSGFLFLCLLIFLVHQLNINNFSLGNIFAETVELKLSKEDVIMTAFRKLDAPRVEALMNLEVIDTPDGDVKEIFFRTVSFPLQGVCRNMKRVGGIWWGRRAVDGDKFVCLDQISDSDVCLIYSFGINNEWSFEDLMDSFNCEVHAYDFSHSAPAKRGNQISFIKKGIGAETTDILDTLEHFLAMNNHTDSTVFYLKLDVEGAELQALPQWLESEALKNVQQIAMEIHLYNNVDPVMYKTLLTAFQQLYALSFRIISHEVNMPMGKLNDGYYELFEIVLMKDTKWNHLN